MREKWDEVEGLQGWENHMHDMHETLDVRLGC
jgi:hypothetical protein